MTTIYEDYLKSLDQKEWNLVEDVPGWELGNVPATIENWHNYNYLDFYEKLIGRPYGANGIGTLREVALVRPTEDEYHPYWNQDPSYFTPLTPRQQVKDEWRAKVEVLARMYEAYAQLLGENGVEVHWVELPSWAGPFGPWHRPSGAIADLFVLRGGIVVGKYGSFPFNNGRAAEFARWAHNNLGIPTLLTIHGTGVAEVAASVWLAEDILMTGHSASFNDEGLRQFIPVVKASSKEDVYVHTIRIPYNGFWDPITGACAHPNVIIGALDIGKVILYPPGVDFNTYKWLKEHKFDVVEADKEEHLLHSACNIITLGPGKVIMNAFAKRAIQQVRALGVEVVGVEFGAGVNSTGYGRLDCATSKLRRDPGPSFFN